MQIRTFAHLPAILTKVSTDELAVVRVPMDCTKWKHLIGSYKYTIENI